MLNKNTLKGEIFEYICCQVSFPAKVSFFKYRNHSNILKNVFKKNLKFKQESLLNF